MEDAINDGLHQIIGISDKTLVEYVKSISAKANTKNQLIKGLLDIDIKIDEQN